MSGIALFFMIVIVSLHLRAFLSFFWTVFIIYDCCSYISSAVITWSFPLHLFPKPFIVCHWHTSMLIDCFYILWMLSIIVMSASHSASFIIAWLSDLITSFSLSASFQPSPVNSNSLHYFPSTFWYTCRVFVYVYIFEMFKHILNHFQLYSFLHVTLHPLPNPFAGLRNLAKIFMIPSSFYCGSPRWLSQMEPTQAWVFQCTVICWYKSDRPALTMWARALLLACVAWHSYEFLFDGRSALASICP